mmetsp:Transcript_6919/g.9769  ORF Transcript_6919/g.9769 Transcript_6919/m.9769 type:complete len:353 (+) Transcript_6919:1-1059(+)
MTPFLLSTFGFSCFFKTIAVTFDLQPKGIEKQNFETFCTWFMSLPEPEVNIKDGSLINLKQGEFLHQVWILLQRIVSLSIILSILLHNEYPFGTYNDEPGHYKHDRDWISSSLTSSSWSAWNWKITDFLNSGLYLWFLYTFASFCLEVGAFLLGVQGYKSGRTFDNPLFGSRTYKECWGVRWNIPVHVMLKRSVYKPCLRYFKNRNQRQQERKQNDSTRTSDNNKSIEKSNDGAMIASLLTFGASGLLHEYNFFIHNHAGYQPGHALLFFYYVGGLMMAEELLLGSPTSSSTPKPKSAVQQIKDKIPTPVLAILLQIPVLPLFSHLFIRSWIVSGMLQSLAGMIPTIQCVND